MILLYTLTSSSHHYQPSNQPHYTSFAEDRDADDPIFVVLVIELRRVVPIKNLSGLTKLLKQGSQEFVLHIKKEHDYRLYSEQ